MRRGLLLLTLVATAMLALPSTALAAYVPRFLVNHELNSAGTQNATTIRVTFNREDDATARTQILVPLNYAIDTGLAAGTVVGSASAQVLATAISPDTIAPLEGPIRTADPATQINNQCAPGAHSAVWIAELAFSGQTIPVPFYVDLVPAANQAALGASYTITVCFASPYIPPAQGGAPLGAKILTATLSINEAVTRTPAGAAQNVWRGIFTPYVVNTATANPAGTVEARSRAALPRAVSIVVRVTKRTVRLTGRLTEGGAGVSGIRLVVLHGGARGGLAAFGRATTNASGAYSFTVRFKRKGVHRFRVRATVAERDLGTAGCAPPSPAPAGCVSATAGGFTAQSTITRLIRIR